MFSELGWRTFPVSQSEKKCEDSNTSLHAMKLHTSNFSRKLGSCGIVRSGIALNFFCGTQCMTKLQQYPLYTIVYTHWKHVSSTQTLAKSKAHKMTDEGIPLFHQPSLHTPTPAEFALTHTIYTHICIHPQMCKHLLLYLLFHSD